MSYYFRGSRASEIPSKLIRTIFTVTRGIAFTLLLPFCKNLFVKISNKFTLTGTRSTWTAFRRG